MKSPDGQFFSGNRRRVASKLDGGVLVLTAHDSLQATADMAFPFRQEANFYYLSGIDSPRWRLVYDSARDYCWLVRPNYSRVERLFDGALSDEAALASSGANQVIDDSEFEALLRQLTRQHGAVYGLAAQKVSDYSFDLNPAPARLYTLLERNFARVIDSRRLMSQVRALKQPTELDMIKKAVRITADAFADAKQQATSLKSEYELEAVFTHQFRRANTTHAYEPIVASGENALLLHYVANNQKFARRNLVLCDVGAQYSHYAADVTRMIAIKPPTKRQTAVYQALLSAQQAIIADIEPNMPVDQYHKMTDRHMHSALIELGLMTGDWDESLYRKYFPHAVSHGLGLDVHDSLGGTAVLRESMVLTVEPGIYIQEEAIGMRIEDDVLITNSGASNLSQSISTNLD